MAAAVRPRKEYSGGAGPKTSETIGHVGQNMEMTDERAQIDTCTQVNTLLERLGLI